MIGASEERRSQQQRSAPALASLLPYLSSRGLSLPADGVADLKNCFV
jgi:hypothetical protein